MGIIRTLKRTRLAGLVRERIYHKTVHYADRLKDRDRLKRYRRIDRLSGSGSLEGRLVMDKVDIVVTTKCNLLCSGCSHLMPYYKNPGHLDKDRVIASMEKLAEAVDWFDHFNVLGGEPFLDPELKDILEAVPAEKCRLVQLLTNATVIPDDPALFDVLRRKKVRVVITPYPTNEKTRGRLIEVLEAQNVTWGGIPPHGRITDSPGTITAAGRSCGGSSTGAARSSRTYLTASSITAIGAPTPAIWAFAVSGGETRWTFSEIPRRKTAGRYAA